MSQLMTSHDDLYFDTLRRKNKKEAVKSLIFASYNVYKLNEDNKLDDKETKKQIALELKKCYDKFLPTGALSYTGTLGQFASQYTIGHEMCIYKDSSLKLTPLAMDVANENISIVDYFDRIFLNYFQPVRNSNVHILYYILKYIINVKSLKFDKSELSSIYGWNIEDQFINSLCNFLGDTSYFNYENNQLEYISDKTPEYLLSLCNLRYNGIEGYNLSQIELSEESNFNYYMASTSGDYLNPVSVAKFKLQTTSNQDFATYIFKFIERNGIYLDTTDLDILIKDYKQINHEIPVLLDVTDVFKEKGEEEACKLRYDNYNRARYYGDIFFINNRYFLLSAQHYAKTKLPHKENKVSLLNWFIKCIKNKGVIMNNKILYGPPGTGKTRELNLELEKYPINNRFFVSFHQSFSYEDFVEGIRTNAINGQVNYVVEEGIFYKACNRAAEILGYTDDDETTALDKYINAIENKNSEIKTVDLSDNNNIVIVGIDEINRGNVAAIFGELITLIEEKRRLGASENLITTLPYSKKKFSVPSNLVIVGTMNTTDRSTQVLDMALRRRFEFVELLPRYDILSTLSERFLRRLNIGIKATLGKDFQIGHSYLIGCNNYISIFNALKTKILPLLEEYYYNEIEKIKVVLREDDEKLEKVFYVIDNDAREMSFKIDSDDEKDIYKLNEDIFNVTTDEEAKEYLNILNE